MHLWITSPPYSLEIFPEQNYSARVLQYKIDVYEQ